MKNKKKMITTKYKYKKKKPSEFNQTATICLNGQEMQFVSHFLSSCINDAYYPITYRNNFQVKPSMVHRSIWAMRFGCRTLADKSGKKRGGIALGESVCVSHPVASAKLVTDTFTQPRKCCNLDHEPWCNPWNKALASTDSFVDLFHLTLRKVSSAYYFFNACLSSSVPLEEQDFHQLLTELGNYSYHSGLPVS